VTSEPPGTVEARPAGRGWRSYGIEAAHVLLMIAVATSVAEAGALHQMIFGGPGARTYADFQTVHYVDASGRSVPPPPWWPFMLGAAMSSLILLTPLLILPVLAAGATLRAVARRWPLALALASAIVLGATVGAAISYAMKALVWDFGGWHEQGFAGLVAGGACGVMAVVARGRGRGVGLFLTEITLATLIGLAAGSNLGMRR
jgi:hypothetical protein